MHLDLKGEREGRLSQVCVFVGGVYMSVYMCGCVVCMCISVVCVCSGVCVVRVSTCVVCVYYGAVSEYLWE